MRFLANLSQPKRPCRVKYLTSRLIRLRRRPRSSGVHWQSLGLTIALILGAAILVAAVAYGAVTPSLGSASFMPRLITAALEMRNATRDGTHAAMRGEPLVQNNQGSLEATNARAA